MLWNLQPFVDRLFAGFQKAVIVSQSDYHIVVDADLPLIPGCAWNRAELIKHHSYNPVPDSQILSHVEIIPYAMLSRQRTEVYGETVLRWKAMLRADVGCTRGRDLSFGDNRNGLEIGDMVRLRTGGSSMQIFGFTLGGWDAWCEWSDYSRHQCFKTADLVKISTYEELERMGVINQSLLKGCQDAERHNKVLQDVVNNPPGVMVHWLRPEGAVCDNIVGWGRMQHMFVGSLHNDLDDAIREESPSVTCPVCIDNLKKWQLRDKALSLKLSARGQVANEVKNTGGITLLTHGKMIKIECLSSRSSASASAFLKHVKRCSCGDWSAMLSDDLKIICSCCFSDRTANLPPDAVYTHCHGTGVGVIAAEEVNGYDRVVCADCGKDMMVQSSVKKEEPKQETWRDRSPLL